MTAKSPMDIIAEAELIPEAVVTTNQFTHEY